MVGRWRGAAAGDAERGGATASLIRSIKSLAFEAGQWSAALDSKETAFHP